MNPNPQIQRKASGTLHCADYSEEITIDSTTQRLKEVVSIKSTAKNTIVLNKRGCVFVISGAAAEESVKEFKFPSKAIQISAGIEHGACLLDDGRAYVWGSFENPGYRFKDECVPVQILSTEHIIEIASGRDHLLLLNSNGIIFSLGCAEQGQLGRVPKRSAYDGGRRGVKLLLQPDHVHTNKKHVVDKIWATRRGTFYRDKQTGLIFGCGDNAKQKVAPHFAKDQQQEQLYKPVQTDFKHLKDVTDSLVLTEQGDLLSPVTIKNDGSIGKWRAVAFEDATELFAGHQDTNLIDGTGDLFAWTSNRLAPIEVVSKANQKRARVLDVSRVKDKIFLVIA